MVYRIHHLVKQGNKNISTFEWAILYVQNKDERVQEKER